MVNYMVKIVEVRNSKQIAKIMLPSKNKLLEKVIGEAYLLEVIDIVPTTNLDNLERET